MRKKCFLKTKLSTRWSVTEGILTLLQHLNHRVENDLVISLSITVLWTCWLIVRVKEVLKRDCCRCGIRCFECVKEGHHRSPYCQNDKSYHRKGEPWNQIFSRPARPESFNKHFSISSPWSTFLRFGYTGWEGFPALARAIAFGPHTGMFTLCFYMERMRGLAGHVTINLSLTLPWPSP